MIITMFHLLVLAQSLQRLETAARATGSLQAQATLCEVAATILKAGSNAAPPCTSEAPCQAVASEPGSCEPSSICGCSTVLTSGCPSCPKTLQDLIAPSLQQHYCASDQDCNAPRGRCRRGRCRCAPGWGLRNCSFENGATGGSDPHFSERVYSGYYSNLTFAGKTLASPTESRQSRGTSLSGPGSNAEETAGVRTVLPVLLSLMRVRTVLDVPCGDFNYMREVLSAAATPPGIVYQGLDIVSSLVAELQATFGTPSERPNGPSPHRISFGRFDLALEYLWPADLVVVRDVLFHFSAERAAMVLRRIAASGCRYALIVAATHAPHGSTARERGSRPTRAGTSRQVRLGYLRHCCELATTVAGASGA